MDTHANTDEHTHTHKRREQASYSLPHACFWPCRAPGAHMPAHMQAPLAATRSYNRRNRPLHSGSNPMPNCTIAPETPPLATHHTCQHTNTIYASPSALLTTLPTGSTHCLLPTLIRSTCVRACVLCVESTPISTLHVRMCAHVRAHRAPTLHWWAERCEFMKHTDRPLRVSLMATPPLLPTIPMNPVATFSTLPCV